MEFYLIFRHTSIFFCRGGGCFHCRDHASTPSSPKKELLGVGDLQGEGGEPKSQGLLEVGLCQRLQCLVNRYGIRQYLCYLENPPLVRSINLSVQQFDAADSACLEVIIETLKEIKTSNYVDLIST